MPEGARCTRRKHHCRQQARLTSGVFLSKLGLQASLELIGATFRSSAATCALVARLLFRQKPEGMQVVIGRCQGWPGA